MKLFKKNKRGNWFDIFVWAGITLLLAISLSVTYYFNDQLTEKLLDIDVVSNNTDANTLLTDHRVRAPFIWDFIVPLIFVGLLIFSGISARKIPTTHTLAPITIIVGSVLVLLGIVIEIVWDKIVSGTNPFALKIVSDLTLTNAFMSHFIYFTVIYIFVVGVTLYSKDE